MKIKNMSCTPNPPWMDGGALSQAFFPLGLLAQRCGGVFGVVFGLPSLASSRGPPPCTRWPSSRGRRSSGNGCRGPWRTARWFSPGETPNTVCFPYPYDHLLASLVCSSPLPNPFYCPTICKCVSLRKDRSSLWRGEPVRPSWLVNFTCMCLAWEALEMCLTSVGLWCPCVSGWLSGRWGHVQLPGEMGEGVSPRDEVSQGDCLSVV